MKTEFSQQILENTRTQNLMKISPVEAEMYHADGQTNGETRQSS
jgi:flagellar biosynthesis/type III secretory pathway chaperone